MWSVWSNVNENTAHSPYICSKKPSLFTWSVWSNVNQKYCPFCLSLSRKVLLWRANYSQAWKLKKDKIPENREVQKYFPKQSFPKDQNNQITVPPFRLTIAVVRIIPMPDFVNTAHLWTACLTGRLYCSLWKTAKCMTPQLGQYEQPGSCLYKKE